MIDLNGLRICFLAGTLGQGGAERQLFYILNSLTNHGARLRLLSLTRGEFWEDKIRSLGVPVIWVGQQEARPVRLARIIAELRTDPPDVIQSQHFFTNLYAAVASRALGLREVGSVRGSVIRETKTLGKAGMFSLRMPRVVAANSKAAIDEAVSLGISPGRLHYLPNAINTNRFTPAAQRDRNLIRLITVGRLIELKRLDLFLRALARLQHETSAVVKGVVVGDGPLRGDLEHLAAKLGLLPDIVEFKGSVADVSLIYQEADVLVMTSESEGTPNVILEAMTYRWSSKMKKPDIW